MAATLHAQSESLIISALKRREEEALEILQTSNDPEHIRLVYVWFPFSRHKLVDLISTQWIDILDCLQEKQNDSYWNDWNNEGFKVEKAEEILKSLKPEEPLSARRDLEEALLSLGSGLKTSEMSHVDQMAYASRIALVIDSRISTAFCNTPFSEVVRAACGHKSLAFENLLDVASHLRTELSKLFRRLDQPNHIYKLINQELRLRDPLVRWTLHTSQHDARGSLDISQSLVFLFRPIQHLFARQDLTIITILECVAVLAVHYKDKVVSGTHADWERFSSPDFSFLEWLGNLGLRETARRITDNDEDRFLNLRVIDLRSKTAYFRCLEMHWDVLAENIKACCLALPDSIEKISSVVEYLIRFRNLYSATALLIGLLNAQKSPKELALFWRLINTEDHYAFYRSQWSRAPALPFIPPHAYGKNSERKLYDFYRFVLYSGWREQGNEDDLSSYSASDSALNGASSESDQRVSEDSSVWCNALAFLKSLVYLLYHFFPLRRFAAHGSLDSDVEKCLSGSQTLGFSLSLRDTELSNRHSIPGIESSVPSTLRPAHLRD